MAFFENISIGELLEADDAYTFPPFTDADLAATEQALGWKLPPSYLALLKMQNGGYINSDLFGESWLTAIYGVNAEGGLIEWFDNWIHEWEYPNIGIPFGETQSAGHDMYFMDFSVTDANGEPRIVLIDNECGNSVKVVAANLEEFLTRIYQHEEV